MTTIEGAGPAGGRENLQQVANEQKAKRRQAREEQENLRTEQNDDARETQGEANNQIDATG